MVRKYAIIGDIHGCYDELRELIIKVYSQTKRQFVFLGDLCDRGPDSIGVIQEVMDLVSLKYATLVPGNHDNKFARFLKGNAVKLSHGLDKTVKQWNEFQKRSPKRAKEIKDWFIDYVLDHKGYEELDYGCLVVAHAGIKDDMIGKDGKRVLSMCLYGDVSGSFNKDVARDAKGYPIRKDWAAERQTDHPTIVHGHTIVNEVTHKNGVFCIDTGCVYGGHLTAMLYPEMEFIQVKAKKAYAER